MTDPDRIDMAGVADALGFHGDTVRKWWRAWADPQSPHYVHFPPPFRYPPPGRKGRCWWRASAIAEWKLARERALGQGRACPPSYRNETAAERHATAGNPRLSQQRAALARLQERA